MSHFKDRVALVTGAASGIGAALTEALAGQGAVVLATDRDEAGCVALAGRLSAGGSRVEGAGLDVTDAESFQSLVDELASTHGRIDFLFNNAGVGLLGEVRDLELSHWRRQLDVNLWGVIHGVHAVYPRMVEQGCGHIVNTSSGAGLLPRPHMVPYAAAKHAVVGLSTSLRSEAKALGVRVSVVCPGYVKTGIAAASGFVGLDAEALRSRKLPIPPISAAGCARAILRGTRRNRAIIPVTRVTRVEWWLSRVHPALALWLAGYRARAIRSARTVE